MDPDHLTVEHLNIGGGVGDGGISAQNGNDIRQTSSGEAPSFITYDCVFVFTPAYNPATWKDNFPSKRGLRLEGLGKNDTVLIKYMQGNFHCVGSAAATILCNVSYNTGHIVVEGKSQDRGGFLGFLTKLGVCENPTLTVKDSQSLVISDLYLEQEENLIRLEAPRMMRRGT